MKKLQWIVAYCVVVLFIISLGCACAAPVKTYGCDKNCFFRNLRIWNETDKGLTSISLNWKGYSVPINTIAGTVLKVEVLAADSERGKFKPLVNATTRLKKKYEGFNKLDVACYSVNIPGERLPYKQTYLKVRTQVNYQGHWLIPFEKMLGRIDRGK